MAYFGDLFSGACMLFQGEHKCRFVSVLSLLTCACLSQGYTLAEEEEDPLIFQHRQLRGNQSDTLVSGPVEPGPMKKLHVSTTALQKVCRMTFVTFITSHSHIGGFVVNICMCQ